MPRSLRPNHPDTWHHVVNRGADHQDVFFTDDDYRKFEWLLGAATAECGVEVHAYCLMTNHFHLLLNCPTAGLSESMQALQFRYAQWFNHRYERDGPVFRGRFKSVLVDSDEQLLAVGRYVHRNPLAFVPSAALAAYRWSSLPAYLGRRKRPDWLSTSPLLQPFDGDVDRFREFVVTDLPSDGNSGSAVPRSTPTCGDVDEAVALVLGFDVAELRRPVPGSLSVGRLLAVGLCVELRTSRTADLAVHYGLTASASVRTIARRYRIRQTADPAFAELRRRVLESMGRVQPETIGA